MISYRLLIGIGIAALLGVFLLVRAMQRVSLRVQFMVLLGLGVTIGFIFLVMVQMRSFPEWFGVSLMLVVFVASLFGTRIFLRSLSLEDKKTEDEAREEYRRGSEGSGTGRSAFRETYSMSRIRILPETIANKIAAGEVVERPASVVKELLENALDAGARSIRIETESGGKRLIRVIDDGCGMNHDDALLAFERHATSKLRTADDLLSIATLGFRGEALPTIAAISRLLLETRDAEEEEGTRIEFAGGKLLSVKPAGVPVGTSISVADIFYAVPARRKFLKSETTELGHIASLVTHYALAHPDRHFLLKTPSQEILNCPPVEKLADRVYQIFGRQALDELTEIPATEAAVRSAITEPPLEAEERAATLRVSGFTSRPEVQRSEPQRHLHFREPPAGARPAAAARHQRGVPQHCAAWRFSGGAAVSGYALRRSGRERASGENRSAFSPPAIRARFHARCNPPGAFRCSADSWISRGARGDSGGCVRYSICWNERRFHRVCGWSRGD